MAAHDVRTFADLGARIAQARRDLGLTQDNVAEALGIDRSAVTKLESGARRISATELVALAELLDRPIDWFVYESPTAVVSRRGAAGRTQRIDRQLERVARDIDRALRRELIRPARRPRKWRLPRTVDEAETTAAAVRKRAGVSDTGGLDDVQAVAETLGMLAFIVDMGDDADEGAYVDLNDADVGVAVVNGGSDSARIRYTVAHELGHHLFGDSYSIDAAGATAVGDDERMINAFAVHFLMPRTAVQKVWSTTSARTTWERAVQLGAEFRVSWTAVCNQLRNLNLIDHGGRERLLERVPTRADFIEMGLIIKGDPEPPLVPPVYGRQVIEAYRAGKLTPERTSELLLFQVTSDYLAQSAPREP